MKQSTMYASILSQKVYLCNKSEKNDALLKNSPNYKMLHSNMAQQILKEVDASFKKFFGLLKLAKQGKCTFQDCQSPHDLPKDSFTILLIGFVRRKGDKLILPYSHTLKKTYKPVEIKIPPILANKHIREIKIIPQSYRFSGKHIQRGMYRTTDETEIHADINGVWNIKK